MLQIAHQVGGHVGESWTRKAIVMVDLDSDSEAKVLYCEIVKKKVN